MADEQTYLTLQHAARLMGIDPHDLAAKIVGGVIPSIRTADGRVLIALSEVDQRT
jgi:hypothetical protein